MEKLLAIAEFFNLNISILTKDLSPEIIEKMKTAYSQDDFMKLHHLGYELNKIET